LPTVAESLNSTRPGLWIEVSPPRGVNPELLLKRLAALQGHVDAINLTDNSLGKVKMSGLVFGSIVKARLGLSVVLNVSCRDRNRFALKSDLLGAAAMKIDAVVALTGDKIPPGADGSVVVSHDLDAFSLLAIIGELNRGDTGEGKIHLKMLPNLYPGAVANPNRRNLEREFELLARKAKAGARFVITQPVFERETAVRFISRANELGLKTVLGILPIKREAMASYMKDNVKDLSAAAGYLDRYAGKSEDEVRAESLAANLVLMQSLAGEVAAFNIMSGGGPSLAIELALSFSAWRKENLR
jgi:5,10-methylenetetrahydrofolate reductase